MSSTSPTNDRFRPRARIMLTLGLELISSETVALAELVKNSYDADATFVVIRLTRGERPEDTRLEVLDDGVGMSPATVAGTWLEPATPSRRKRIKSLSGRRSLGEKGLGRFATAKLATGLTLTTRERGGAETKLDLDWNDFEDPEKYLDEVRIPWSSGRPVAFAPGGVVQRTWKNVLGKHLSNDEVTKGPRYAQGTLIELSGLREQWSAQLAEDVERTLSRLVTPNPPPDSVQSDFTIILDLPDDLSQYGGVVGPPEELRRPHYRLDATVDEHGLAIYTVRLRGDDRKSVEQSIQLTGAEGREPVCGPFSLRILAWDRDRAALEAIASPGSRYQDVRQALNRVAGVSVYRDGFRVLPYGEVGDDWLALDRRRIDAPTRRLSNNQVVGTVVISRDKNPGLSDQTNREGLVAGAALEDFRAMILELVALLERLRADERPKSPGRATTSSSITEVLRLDSLRHAAEVRRDGELTALVDEAQQEIVRRTDETREVLSRYQRLATLGQLVDKMVHEIGQPTAASRAAAVSGLELIEDYRAKLVVQSCEDILDSLVDEFDLIRSQSRSAMEILNRLAPFGGRRRGRPREIVLQSAIQESVELLRGEIERVGAVVSLPSGRTLVTVDGTELQEIVINLLTNSIYWVTRGLRGSERRIDLAVERNPDDSVSVLVSDTGPGVPIEDRDRIFDPYFTNRAGGFGLGLSIAGEIVSEYYGGELELVNPGKLGGATFRATLRRRVGAGVNDG